MKNLTYIIICITTLFSAVSYAIPNDKLKCLDTEDYLYYSAFITKSGGNITLKSILENTRTPSAFLCTNIFWAYIHYI